MTLIDKFVDWLFSEPKAKEVDLSLDFQVPAPTKKNIDAVKSWLSENNNYQDLVAYYRYSEKVKAPAEVTELIKTKAIEACEAVGTLTKETYFPDN